MRHLTSKYEQQFALQWLVTTAIAAFILAVLIAYPFFDTGGNFLYDQLQAFSKVRPSSDIVVIVIDEKSPANLTATPIFRANYTVLLKKLADENAMPRVIAFDFPFASQMLTGSELFEQVARHHVVLPIDLRYQKSVYPKQSLLPVSAIQTTSLRYGHIETHVDSDGVVRGAQLYSSGVPHLALLLSEQSISPSAQNYRRFAMVNSKTGFRTIALSDVLSDAFPITTLKDKYLLLGASSPNLVSQYPTISSNSNNQPNTQPKRQLSSALEIHASLLNALLQDKLINQPSAGWGYAISLVCLLAVLIGLLVLSPAAEMMLTISLIALMLLTSFGLLKFFNIWLDPLPAALAMLLVKPVWAWRRMEMISHCMQQNILSLAGSDEKQTAMPKALSSRSIFLRYTQILSEAIQSVNERLHFLSLVISEIPEAVLIADEHGLIMRHNQKMSAIFEEDMLKKGHLMANLFAHLEVFSDEQISALLHRPYSEERFAALDKNGALREYRMRVLPLPFSKLNYWQF